MCISSTIFELFIKVANFNLPHLHFVPLFGVTSFEFYQDLRHQKKTRLSGLSCGIVCMILRLAISVEHQLVTDKQTDGQTDTWWQLIPMLANVVRVKTKINRKLYHNYCMPLIYNVTLWHHYQEIVDVDVQQEQQIIIKLLAAEIVESAEIHRRLSSV